MLHSQTVSDSPKKDISSFITAVVALTLFVYAIGCSALDKKPPSIEAIAHGNSELVGLFDIDALPIDWERAKELWATYEPQFRADYGQQFVDDAINSQLSPRDFSKFAFAADNLNLTSQKRGFDSFQSIQWVIGVDIHGYLTVDVLDFAIQRKVKEASYETKRGEKINGFEQIEVFDPIDGKTLLVIAIFPSKNTQIRVGHPSKVAKSILEVKPESPESDTHDLERHRHQQAWFSWKIPATALSKLSELETNLPFETGSLLSGFNNIAGAVELTDYDVNPQVLLDFDNRNSRETAHSLLQLLTNFVLKPSIKKYIPEAKDLVKSLRQEATGDSIVFRANLSEHDAMVLKEKLKERDKSSFLRFALDLIQRK